MGRTTIDGLSVRSSGSNKPKPKKSAATRRSNKKPVQQKPRVIDDFRPQGRMIDDFRPSSLPQEKVMAPSKPRATAGDDFLSPVHGFGYVEPGMEAENSLAAESGADWSDLLNGLDENEQNIDLNLFGDDIEPEEDEGKKKRKSRKKDKKGKKKHKHLALKIFLLLLVIAGVVLFVWGDALISRLTGGRSGFWDAISSLVSDEVPFETDANGRTNVLVFGTEGYTMDADASNDQHDGAQLTDSIMVISFDQKTKDVALLSLPRDLKVGSAACYAGKVNEIFTCANPDGTNEEAGAQAMMREIGSVLGIDFQYFAHVNWSSLIDIIDTLGGITVTLDEDIDDYYYTGAVVKAGEPVTVNGEQALGLARARHGTNGGDFTRGNTQQKIVEGIVQKVINDGIGVTEALNILNILGDNLRSNFSTDNVKSGISLLSGFDINNIRNISLVNYETETYYVTTDMINGVSYVLPAAGVGNFKEIREFVAAMLSSNPAVREGAKIIVLNGTETPGVAGTEQTKLENDGYKIQNIGDAPAGSCDQKYCVFALNENMPETKNALAGRYGIEIFGAESLPDGIWPGEADFVVIVGKAE